MRSLAFFIRLQPLKCWQIIPGVGTYFLACSTRKAFNENSNGKELLTLADLSIII